MTTLPAHFNRDWTWDFKNRDWCPIVLEGPVPGPVLLPAPAVALKVGLGERTIAGMVDAGTFPPPLRIGLRLLWVSDEVDGWLHAHIATVRAAMAAEDAAKAQSKAERLARRETKERRQRAIQKIEALMRAKGFPVSGTAGLAGEPVEPAGGVRAGRVGSGPARAIWPPLRVVPVGPVAPAAEKTVAAKPITRETLTEEPAPL